MRLRIVELGVLLITLAACTTRPTLPTPPGPTVTLAAQTNPSPSMTSTAAATSPSTAVPATATLQAATQAAAAVTLPASADEPLLQAYRALISMQINAELLAQTAAYQQTGRLDEDDLAVAALALIALTQSVDDSVAGVTPPLTLTAAWQAGLAAHHRVKSLGARWALGQLTGAQVVTEITPVQTQLEQAMVTADQALAANYGLQPDATTRYRHRVIRAVGVIVGADTLP